MSFKKHFNQKGQIALLITLVILGAILSIGLGLTLVTIKEMKMAKNIEESAKALVAADAGMEYAFYKIDNEEAIEADRICPDYKDLDNGASYCINTDDPDNTKSIGKFGNIKRAMISAGLGNLDQFNVSAGPYYTNDPCNTTCSNNCTSVGGGFFAMSRRLAQTFQSDTTGCLAGITVWSGICQGGGTFANPATWQIELRDEDSGKPGDTVLGQSNNVGVPVCGDGACRQLDFTFDPPLDMTKGQKYSFVVKKVFGPEGVRIKTATQGVYLSGRAWYSNNGNWKNDCFGSCPNSGSDLVFKIFISSPPGGKFEETRP